MNLTTAVTQVEIRHYHVCCGGGPGARGFNMGSARVGNLLARMRCIGGVDHDPLAITDFNRLAGVNGTLLDLFSAEQYRAFHGKEPPAGWREATPDDIRRSAGGEFPHIVFTSMPCKGFSGLLAESRSASAKYQALNGLTLRGVWLTLEAFKDDPPELWIFENVPRIANRGRHLLDQIKALFRAHGYAVEETAHDCGEIGGLSQSRKRFLMVARHMAKVPPFLYEPPKKRLRGVGDVLDRLPMPGDPCAGPMHRIPSLQWKTWVRLAFVQAGKDWRSLNRLAVEDGMLRDYGIVPEREFRNGAFGVMGWPTATGAVCGESFPTNGRFAVADPRAEEDLRRGALGLSRWADTACTVTSRGFPLNGAFSVADPRPTGMAEYSQLGIRRWDEPSGAVSSQSAVGGGKYAVADPRAGIGAATHNNVYRVVRFDDHSNAVTGGQSPSAGGLAVADPRPMDSGHSKYAVTPYGEAARTVISGSTTGQGAFAVADPRCDWNPNAHRSKLRVTPYDDHVGAITGSSSAGHGFTSGAMSVADPRPSYLKDGREAYLTAGMYGVLPYEAPAGSVNANACHDNGKWSVADPRLPALDERLACVILAEDNTWHRPFTTLELAALQTMFDPDEEFEPVETEGGARIWQRRKPEPWMLAGTSDSRHRECIGNAVPSAAAQAIASTMAHTLLLAWSGHTFVLSNTPIWVMPPAERLRHELSIALSVNNPVHNQESNHA
ncbi:conserved protein of unknown function (C-5 cytosine methyltransferase 91-215; S-adenosyl-L-methionine-dependent methyltransferases 12-675) [Magnetospirillum sp. XM-1]|uniref:DNA cytosine methyltransferase n=1 Tax=Magnetospirillum sp. XM-1 TaxID=1663591 RepID=UPI00073E0E00|nr:DNA cytosine methyltransferase [Magnetospirillum sp. XM-1]CUW41660.1 conserved protein of unknown function (C-5 cytosine methyltransferase 91-215; S-adenosyl-L-methionine-dependent methyltransferases 12-675) [Magnetospirillum sp. XM-1]